LAVDIRAYLRILSPRPSDNGIWVPYFADGFCRELGEWLVNGPAL
jgi:hypothetical protein